MRRILLYLRSLDWIVLSLVGLLITFGLIILYSLTLNVEYPDIATFHQQALFAVLGLILLLVLSIVDYRYLRNFGWILYGIGVVFLLVVLAFGTEIRGAKSWFVVGGITIQPVEFVKIFLIVFFAKYFSEHTQDRLSIRHLLVAGFGAGLAIALIVLQPDLGSALILLALFTAIAILVNVRRSHLLLLLAAFLVGAVMSWFFLFRDYQRERIRTVFNPSRDPLGIGYNVKQSTVAIGSGGLFGRGLGLGSQSRLNFLPEQRNDFIFAVVAEELGFVGASVLFALFAGLFVRLVVLARRSRDDFAVYLLFGFCMLFFVQFVMNVGMNVGLMPVIGVPLPFLSAGGSSLISAMAAIGIIESIAIRQHLFRSRG